MYSLWLWWDSEAAWGCFTFCLWGVLQLSWLLVLGISSMIFIKDGWRLMAVSVSHWWQSWSELSLQFVPWCQDFTPVPTLSGTPQHHITFSFWNRLQLLDLILSCTQEGSIYFENIFFLVAKAGLFSRLWILWALWEDPVVFPFLITLFPCNTSCQDLLTLQLFCSKFFCQVSVTLDAIKL